MRNRFQRQPPKHAVTARLHLAEGITKRAGARHGSGHCPTLFIDIHPCGPAPTAGNAPKRPMRPSHTARFVRQNDRFWQAKRPALQCTETQVVGQRGTDVNIILQKQMPHTPRRVWQPASACQNFQQENHFTMPIFTRYSLTLQS